MGGVGARLLVLSVVMSMVLSADIITDRLEPAAFPELSRMEPRRSVTFPSVQHLAPAWARHALHGADGCFANVLRSSSRLVRKVVIA
jgi:hypothetical protein